MKRLIALLFCLLLATASSCTKDKKDKNKDQPPTKPPVTQPKPPEPPPAQISDQDLAVPADFENAAEAEITKKNYKAELDVLEKEIAAEQ